MLVPHMAEGPHIADVPHIAEVPHIADVPHIAEVPHMAEVPAEPVVPLAPRAFHIGEPPQISTIPVRFESRLEFGIRTILPQTTSASHFPALAKFGTSPGT